MYDCIFVGSHVIQSNEQSKLLSVVSSVFMLLRQQWHSVQVTINDKDILNDIYLSQHHAKNN